MPKLFCALRCLRKKDEDIRLFRIPADEFQRKRWIAAIGFIRTSPEITIFVINISLQVRGGVVSSVKHSVTELGTPKNINFLL